MTDLTPKISHQGDLPKVWTTDENDVPRLGPLAITLDGENPMRWIVWDTTKAEILVSSDVLEPDSADPADYDDGESLFYRVTHALARNGGLPSEGLEDWAESAEVRERAARPPFVMTPESIDKVYREIEAVEARTANVKQEVTELEERTEAGSYADRVTSTKVDLAALWHEDLSTPPPIPGSGGVICKGVRHLWPMERKGGKSIATLVTSVDIVLAGGRVVILDRENGRKRFGFRAKAICDARNLSPEQVSTVHASLSYYDRPRIRNGDAADLVAEMMGADLVIFDSSRKFMSGLDLAEDKSDDYTTFMEAMVDPLFDAEIATLILDNSGWSDKGRPRGSSAKEDLNETLFIAEKREDFDLETTGKIVLGIKESRDGLTGTWTMRIGGGVYESWEKAPEGEHVGGGEGQGSKSKREKEDREAKMLAMKAENPDITKEELATKLGVSVRTVESYLKATTTPDTPVPDGAD